MTLPGPMRSLSRFLAASRFLLPLLLPGFGAVTARGAEVHGTVTNLAGDPVSGVAVVLIHNGKVTATGTSRSDGSFDITSGASGRFYLAVSSQEYRQLETPGFYAGQLDSLERNLVLEPVWVRDWLVVTPSGAPAPQRQSSAATSVLGPVELDLPTDLVQPLRLMPGTFVVQSGQMGAPASLLIRGGDPEAGMVLLDGVSAEDIGGRFDLGNHATVALERAEVYRGPDSNLYGPDASTGVVSLTTPHGTTSYPSLIFNGDVGRFDTLQGNLTVAGARGRIDYLGEFNWLQTANDLPLSQFHVATTAASLGWQPETKTAIRGTVHYGVAATGVPGAWSFHEVADDATRKDQDLYVSAAIDNQTTPGFHNMIRYGLARKREQYYLWQPGGELVEFDPVGGRSAYYGNTVTIRGANGYSVTGRAQLDLPGTYPFVQYLDSNRDQLIYQGTFRVSTRLTALIGFHYADERGSDYVPSVPSDQTAERVNFDYLAGVGGSLLRNRLFYNLGGSLEHSSLFGTEASPRGGFSVYALRPKRGIFSGSRIYFSFGDAIREPSLEEQFLSLYQFLTGSGFGQVAAQLHIPPPAPPAVRTYEGGGEQAFLSSRIVLRVSYFHNQFGREIEPVDASLLPTLTTVDPALQQQLIAALGPHYAANDPFLVNTGAFRAQGIETTVEGGLGRSLFLRGGYTYLDSVVKRSFSSDNQAAIEGTPLAFAGIPLGADSPLKGARPFNRPPHTGFLSASYSAHRLTAVLTGSFAGRSDDSTFLAGADISGGNSLLLPNRNLDLGYARLDLGGSMNLLSWLGVYALAENLTDNQHIAPIGYVSLPFSLRGGLRLQWTRSTR